MLARFLFAMGFPIWGSHDRGGLKLPEFESIWLHLCRHEKPGTAKRSRLFDLGDFIVRHTARCLEFNPISHFLVHESRRER